MKAIPNKKQIEYTSASVQDNGTYRYLELFFELRRDDESPFTALELEECYGISRSFKTFAPRAGDLVVILSQLPARKKAYDLLAVRKACGLYGIARFLPGVILYDEKLVGDYERDYYIINPQKDGRLLDMLASECITVTHVGIVTRNGYSIVSAENVAEPIEIEEQDGKEAVVPRKGQFEEGYIRAIKGAFEGTKVTSDGDIGIALGIFAAQLNTKCYRSFTYKAPAKGDGLFVFPISALGRLPDKRAKSVFKRISKGAFAGSISGCVVFNDGDLSAAINRIYSEEATDEQRHLRNGIWYALIASKRPVRGGYYLGRI